MTSEKEPLPETKTTLSSNTRGGDQSAKLAPSTNTHSGLCPPAKPQGTAKQEESVKKYNESLITCANSLLREIRVEINEIARTIDEHITGQLNIKNHVAELKSSRDQVASCIHSLINNYLPELPPGRRDTYQEIINLWELVSANTIFDVQEANELSQKDEQDKLRELNLFKLRLGRLIFMIGYATAMERLNNWVAVSAPGYALPFHRIFEDEITSEVDRQRILNLYSLKPNALKGGLIDPVRGVVLCYPSCRRDRLFRHLIVLLMLIMSFALVWYVSILLLKSSPPAFLIELKLENVPARNLLLFSWSAMLLGILAHLLVAGAKLTNVDFRQFPLPLRDWSFYLSARTSVLMYKIILALLIFAAVFVSMQGKMGLLDAFLIGYSFDSVIELVGASMEKSAGNRLAALKEKSGLTS